MGVHYFEECNIQLSSNYSGSMDVAGEVRPPDHPPDTFPTPGSLFLVLQRLTWVCSGAAGRT